MIRRFWRWLHRADDNDALDARTPQPHAWTAWTVTGARDGVFGIRQEFQRRRCVTCGLTQESPVSHVEFVECVAHAQEAK